MTSLNNGKLIAGRNDDSRDLLRPIPRNFMGVQPGRKIRKNIDPRKNYGPQDILRMQMERHRQKCSVFLDHENLDICARGKGINIDHYDLKYYLADESEGRVPQEFFCYVSVDPRKEHAKDRDIRQLEDDGWLVKCKRGVPAPDGSFKCNIGVDMAIDIISFAIEARPDIVVLVTGNQDFVAVARKMRERGIRCEVAAFPENVSQALINSASSFINLDRYCDALRADVRVDREASKESFMEPDYSHVFDDNLNDGDENGFHDGEKQKSYRPCGYDGQSDSFDYCEYDI
ncbi:MAG: NYN domain-containing protein [Synergistaceae bacterium]|jgi:uncharacterized LabA/DUF88 family protein|nr:NYN domain-containing protein [Synergistaceae bacterium]